MLVDRVVRHERRQGLEAGCRGMGQSPAERGAVDVGRNTTQCDAMQVRCRCSQCKGPAMRWLAWALGVLFVKRRRSRRDKGQGGPEMRRCTA